MLSVYLKELKTPILISTPTSNKDSNMYLWFYMKREINLDYRYRCQKNISLFH